MNIGNMAQEQSLQLAEKKETITTGKDSSPAKKNVFFIHPYVADAISITSSLIIGSITAWRLIEERAYKNVSSQGMWDDIKAARVKKGPEILSMVNSGAITGEQGHRLLRDAIIAGETAADDRLKRVASYGITKQFNLLRGHQKWEVAVSTVAVAGIALGSILLLTRGIFSPERQQLSDQLSGKNGNHLER